MKILTNVHHRVLAGINQVVSSFASYTQRQSSPVELVGVVLESDSRISSKNSKKSSIPCITLRTPQPDFSDLLARSESLEDFAEGFRPIIEMYMDVIRTSRPDVVLLNGTYYLPWCLMTAAAASKTPMILHYHGSITKETEYWRESERRELMRSMERSFLRPGMRYIFPSAHAKQVVEEDVHGTPLPDSIIIPNPIPKQFFKATSVKSKKNVGVVSRWAQIKNIDFVKKFAKLNARRGAPLIISAITDLANSAPIRQELEGLVKFLRPRTNERLAEFYARMAIVLCPSHFETYGNVAQESVATGTPALVNRNMGVAEIFQRIGLDRLVVDFASTATIHDTVEDVAKQAISNEERRNLENEAGAEAIHKRLMSYFTSR
ncbi:MAG: glycosyltransferase family 4 protein [Patescibacteria group bacterium]|nr:glycosyltransferase family 4 protein [Patescibacteria group bacterium]